MANTETHNNNQNQIKKAPDFSDIQHGPLNNNQRQCRDILCLLLFLANIVVLAVIGIWAYSVGKPRDAFRATDKDKNICGQTGTPTADYTFTYIYNPISTDNRVCVKYCPQYTNGVLSTVECYGRDCTYNVKVNEDGTIGSSFTATDFIGYGSYDVLGRVCIPELKVLNNAFSSYSTSIANKLNSSYLNHFISDIQKNWYYILAGFGFAIVISFILMFLMRWIAALLVWLSIVLIFLIFIGIALIFLYQGGTIQSNTVGNTLGTLGVPTLQKNSYYNVYGYISFGVAGVLFICFLCCCRQIRLAVAICKVAGKFVLRVPQVMIVPIIITLLVLGLWAFALSAQVYIVSTATFVANGDIFTSINDYTQRSLGMFYYFFFGILWVNAYFGALSIFVVATCCCMWYFTRGPDDQLSSPVTTGFYRSFRFHWGSLALGALILAIIQLLQIIVEIVKNQINNQNDNKCVQCAIYCLQCCLKCLQRIIQYLNKQAYIQIALRGKNFCFASIDGVSAILSNPARYGILSGVGSVMLFITQLLIVAGAVGLFYILITFNQSIRNNVMEPIFLLVVVGLGSGVISMVFMSVYSVAMDTILSCFISDQENQKGKNGKPLYAPQQMADLMDK